MSTPVHVSSSSYTISLKTFLSFLYLSLFALRIDTGSHWISPPTQLSSAAGKFVNILCWNETEVKRKRCCTIWIFRTISVSLHFIIYRPTIINGPDCLYCSAGNGTSLRQLSCRPSIKAVFLVL